MTTTNYQHDEVLRLIAVNTADIRGELSKARETIGALNRQNVGLLEGMRKARVLAEENLELRSKVATIGSEVHQRWADSKRMSAMNRKALRDQIVKLRSENKQLRSSAYRYGQKVVNETPRILAEERDAEPSEHPATVLPGLPEQPKCIKVGQQWRFKNGAKRLYVVTKIELAAGRIWLKTADSNVGHYGDYYAESYIRNKFDYEAPATTEPIRSGDIWTETATGKRVTIVREPAIETYGPGYASRYRSTVKHQPYPTSAGVKTIVTTVLEDEFRAGYTRYTPDLTNLTNLTGKEWRGLVAEYVRDEMNLPSTGSKLSDAGKSLAVVAEGSTWRKKGTVNYTVKVTYVDDTEVTYYRPITTRRYNEDDLMVRSIKNFLDNYEPQA